MLQSDHIFMVILGRSNTGKSYFLRYLLSENRDDIKNIVMFSETARQSNDFPMIPKKYIHPKYDPVVLEKLFDAQARRLDTQNTTSQKSGQLEPVYVILDDCCSDKQFSDPQLRRLATSGRHYNIKTILTSQYPLLVPPVLRSNATHIYVFNVGPGVRENDVLYQWIGYNYNPEEFKAWVNKYLKAYQCLEIRPGSDARLRLLKAPGAF